MGEGDTIRSFGAGSFRTMVYCRAIEPMLQQVVELAAGEETINPGLDIWDACAVNHVIMPDGSMKLGGEAVAEVFRRVPATRWSTRRLDLVVFGGRLFQALLTWPTGRSTTCGDTWRRPVCRVRRDAQFIGSRPARPGHARQPGNGLGGQLLRGATASESGFRAYPSRCRHAGLEAGIRVGCGGNNGVPGFGWAFAHLRNPAPGKPA